MKPTLGGGNTNPDGHRREDAEGMWKELVRKGWKKVPAVWGVDAEP